MTVFSFLRNAAIVVLLVALINVPFFVNAWSNHTTWVQELAIEGFEDFKPYDIAWGEADLTSNQDVLLEDIRTVIIKNSVLFRSDAFRDENIAYINSLYDLIAILVNNPDDVLALMTQQGEVVRTQQEFYDAVDKFINNHYYAMRYTF